MSIIKEVRYWTCVVCNQTFHSEAAGEAHANLDSPHVAVFYSQARQDGTATLHTFETNYIDGVEYEECYNCCCESHDVDKYPTCEAWMSA
jgi:hypothetical protein